MLHHNLRSDRHAAIEVGDVLINHPEAHRGHGLAARLRRSLRLPSNGPVFKRDWRWHYPGFAIMLWLLRVLGTAAALACAAAHTAGAEPRRTDACTRGAFRVVIDVGHTAQAPGATSARGV